MSKAKHTPGPWVLIDGDRFEDEKVITTQSRINESMCCICEMDVDFDGPHGEEQEANASLIAAAPDLLEALQDMLDAFSKNGLGGEYDPGEVPAIDKAVAAIAKALGEPTT